MAELSDQTRERVGRLLCDEVTRAAAVQRGYSPAGRWRLELRSGRTVFAKVGTTTGTAAALRLEREAYRELNASFMPQLLAWEDHLEQPLLVLEDLSAARWPPPWDESMVDEVRATLEALHGTRARLKRATELYGPIRGGWQKVADDRSSFLGLALTTPAWLDQALPALIQASAAAREDGDDVVHFDVRSDNMCRTTRGIVLVDWNWACLGNGALDTGFWLPSLHAEGGPAPETILARRPDIAACVSGFFAARAGLPAIADAPHVRAVQLQQLGPALRWAARALELPAPVAVSGI